jgi:hypothetical protein
MESEPSQIVKGQRVDLNIHAADGTQTVAVGGKLEFSSSKCRSAILIVRVLCSTTKLAGDQVSRMGQRSGAGPDRPVRRSRHHQEEGFLDRDRRDLSHVGFLQDPVFTRLLPNMTCSIQRAPANLRCVARWRGDVYVRYLVEISFP